MAITLIFGKIKLRVMILVLVLASGWASLAEANRFWVATGNPVPEDLPDRQMVKGDRSLKTLGKENPDGWSVGYYELGEPLVFRGVRSSDQDPQFDRAVRDVAQIGPTIIFGHLRKVASGCVGGIRNPYPLERFANGQTWIFGHDGHIGKSVLLDLLGNKYFKQHQPQVCNFSPPASWVDSELFLMALLKSIEEHQWDVSNGIVAVVQQLRERLPVKDRFLNFFLTNGETLWAYREGNPLFYHDDSDQKITQLASSIPDLSQDGWRVFPEGVIGILEPGNRLNFILLTPSSELE